MAEAMFGINQQGLGLQDPYRVGNTAGSTPYNYRSGTADNSYSFSDQFSSPSTAGISPVQRYGAGEAAGSIGGGVASGATAGATIGSIIPGVGTVVGAGVGAIAGLVTGGIKALFTWQGMKKQEEETERLNNMALAQNAKDEAERKKAEAWNRAYQARRDEEERKRLNYQKAQANVNRLTSIFEQSPALKAGLVNAWTSRSR